MAKLITLLSGAFVALFLAAAPAHAGPDCKCRSNGESFVQGEHTCIKTNDGYRLARCDMVLNLTSWVVVGDSCPLTSLPANEDLKGKLLALLSAQEGQNAE